MNIVLKNNPINHQSKTLFDMIVSSQGNLVRENGFMHINNYGESVYIKYFELTNTKRGKND